MSTLKASNSVSALRNSRSHCLGKESRRQPPVTPFCHSTLSLHRLLLRTDCLRCSPFSGTLRAPCVYTSAKRDTARGCAVALAGTVGVPDELERHSTRPAVD